MTWLSPAFPTGAFAYSHGLETAFHTGLLRDREGLQNWLSALLNRGSGWNDAVLCAEAWRRGHGDGDLRGLAETGEAMAGSLERHLETMAQGQAFLAAASAWPGAVPPIIARSSPLPVAVGAVSGSMGVPLEATLAAYLSAFLSNLVQAALRLGPIGQQDGVAVLAKLEQVTLAVAARASVSSMEDIGSATINSELMALQHETLSTRIFRS